MLLRATAIQRDCYSEVAWGRGTYTVTKTAIPQNHPICEELNGDPGPIPLETIQNLD